MDKLVTLDLLALVVNIIMLYVLGIYDKKLRALPFIPFLFYVALSVVILGVRLHYLSQLGDELMIKLLTLSLVVSAGFIVGLLPVSLYYNMLGMGDVVTIISSAIITPYTPLGVKVKYIPVIIPVSTIIAIILIFLTRRKITIHREDFPKGFRSVIKVRASWFKKSPTVKAYPVYIPRIGFVYEEIFKSDDPQEATKMLIKNLDDDTPIYAIPNFPFVYYYWIGFTVTSITLTLMGLIEQLVR